MGVVEPARLTQPEDMGAVRSGQCPDSGQRPVDGCIGCMSGRAQQLLRERDDPVLPVGEVFEIPA